jgi:hypothetical protein
MSDRAYRKNRSQLVERIKEGTIPTSGSMDKYNFSRDEINELRAINKLPPVTSFARTRTIPDRVITKNRDIKTTEGVANVLEDLKAQEKWKDNTLMGYASRVRSTARLLNIENNLDELKDHESMIELLEEKTSGMKNSTRKGYFGVLSALAGVVPGWKEMLGEEAVRAYAKKARNESDIIEEQREAQKELGKVTPWEEIVEKGVKVAEKDPDRKMIYHLYTMIPPVRSGDYRKVAIIKEDEEKPKKTNFYNIDTGVMTWVVYKTQEHYGEVEIQFPKPLMKIIKTIVEARKDEQQKKWILSTPDGNPVHEKTLQKRIGEVFGVSGTEVRRSYITHVLGEEFSKSRAWLNKRKALAKQMLHSPKIQEEYIRLGLEKLIGQED